MRFPHALAAFSLAAFVTGCSATPGTVPASQQQPPSTTLQALMRGPAAKSTSTKYIQLVIFENQAYANIIGSPEAPYINSLAQTWANMTDSVAITHPSQPNYLALFSGSTQGVTGDNCPVSFKVASLASELLAAKLSFTGYAESMPSVGFTGCQAVADQLPSGWLYMRKHVPWTDFNKIPKKDSQPYPGPLSKPPSRFVWITPNMCNDMHDCNIITGDTWASQNLPNLIAWDQKHNGVLILTFDENDGTPGNQVVTILAGNVNPGSYSQAINHYNVLRTIEDTFGLTPLGQSANVSAITGVLK
jgi:phosphatidylinositol-3-phosphatase